VFLKIKPLYISKSIKWLNSMGGAPNLGGGKVTHFVGKPSALK
jgi:hypothetical protein